MQSRSPRPRGAALRLGALATGALLFGSACATAGPALPDTLFVTWDGAPTSTLTVVWLGDDPAAAGDPLGLGDQAAAAVRFRQDGDAEWRQAPASPRVFAAEQALCYRATIDGLRPDTRVAFRLHDEGTEGASRTLPAHLAAPLTFAIGGDASASAATERTCTQAASRGVAFAVLGGDLAYSNGKRADREVDLLRIWHRTMVRPNGERIPYLAGIGNHEVDGGWTRDRAKAPFFLALFAGLYAERAYAAFDAGDYLAIVLLDSGHLTSIGGDQAAWLDGALAARAKLPHLFAVYHVPAYPSHREPDTKSSPEVRRHWVPLFERHGVDLCFENHDHTYKRTHPLKGGRTDEAAGIVYLGDGCWGVGPREVQASRAWFARAESRNHFFAVTLKPDGSREVIAVDDRGEVFDRVP